MKQKHIFIDPNIDRKGRLLEHHLSEHSLKDAPPLFALIEFNLCGLCNRSCVFCPRSDQKNFPNINEHLPIECYEGVLEDLAEVEFDGTVLYSAFCEPLLYKHLEEIIRLTAQLCPTARIEIVTNGDMLNKDILRMLFDSGLTTLAISMYDNPEQAEHFKKLQDEAGLNDNQFFFRPRWLSRKERFGITLSNRAGAVEMKDLGVNKPKMPINRSCYYPFYQILVDYDGSVLLCAHDWSRRLIAGNVNETSILKIWNCDTLRKVRTSLANDERSFAPCDLCDAEGVLIGREHLIKWMDYYEKK